MTTHTVHMPDKWLRRIRANQKSCDVRKYDRDYQTGDYLEFVNDAGNYTGIRRRITHVLRDVVGLHSDHVVLSLEDPRVAQLADARRENERLVRSNRSLRARARSLTQKLSGA